MESQDEEDGNPELWFVEGFHLVDVQFGQFFNCTMEGH